MYILKIIGAICCLLILSFGVALGAGWHIETLDPEVMGNFPGRPSIDIDTQGKPHLSYLCGSPYENAQVRYAFWNDVNWEVTTIYECPHDLYYTQFALDSQDRPYISYSDEANIWLASFDGAQWTIELVNPVFYSLHYCSLELDNQDQPHLSFEAYDYPSPFHLIYAYKQESEWVNDIIDDNDGSFNDIAIDSQDHPNISYSFRYPGSMQLKYAHWSGSEWEIATIDAGINDLPEGYISLGIDQQDNPHISYYKNDNLYYAYWNGDEWVIQVVDNAPATGYSSSLVIDSQGRAHISYYDITNGNLKYAYFDGSNWHIETVDNQCPGGAYYAADCLALNGWDQPYIVYEDLNNNTLKLAWQGGGLCISLLSFTATPQEDSSVLLNWQVETTEGEQIAGFNLYRHNVVTECYSSPPQKNDEGWTKVNPSLITGQNPYTYTDSTVEPGKTYEYKLEAVLANESAQTLGTTQATTEPSVSFAITKVYPNPASDVLNITLTLPQAGKATLELYDLTGRLVFSKHIQISSPGEFTDQLDVSGLANGVYTLRARQNSAEAAAPMVVAR